jgi:hypothetical protein
MKNKDTWMLLQELLRWWRNMDFVTIPNEHNVPWDQAQQLSPKKNGMFGTKVIAKGACA